MIGLNGVGGIDLAADFFGECEEGRQLFPVVLPGTNCGCVFVPPGLFQLK